MEVKSVEMICKFLISCAFQRCRMLDDLCRLSVSLKTTPPLVLISVSDTGIGSTLEEFQELKYHKDPVLVGTWDGVLCIGTTSISEKEIHHLKYDLKEVVSSRRLVRLPPAAKNGARFSGTEVSFSIYEELDGLVTMVSFFLQKMLLLNVTKIAVDLIVESGGSSKSIVLQKACSALAMNAPNIDHLKLGIEDYVSKHGNRLVESCYSCFSTGKNLKVGSGIACSRENQQNRAQVMEVVIVISNISTSDECSYSRLYDRGTEVLYFQDFSPCSVSQPSLEALTSIEWKNYGLLLKSVRDQDGVALLEWENSPVCSRIDIVLHVYHKQVMILPRTQSYKIERSLTIKAVKLALTDLKKKNAGVLLSQRAVKICSYVPDLAKTISSLIMTSHHLNFQSECLSLLGLQSCEDEKDVVENTIKEKMISVIAINDGTPWFPRDSPALFVDDARQEVHGPDEEYEDEDAFQYLDV